MAVMRNSIIFGGVDSADYGIYIGGEGTFNAPKRDVEMISIPGRNGAFALDKGRFENIEVTYSAFNYETDLATFAQNLSDFRNAICSQKGYQRLTDTFHTDEYRMAAYISGLEIKPIDYNTASKFDIVFDCKPQRFLTSGEDPITIGEWHDTETASGSIASFEAVEGDGVKSLVVDIEPIQSGSGTPSPDNVRPISGYDSVVTSVSPTTSAPDATTYTTNLSSTRYGGTLDVVSGVLTVTKVSISPTTVIGGYGRANGDFIGKLATDAKSFPNGTLSTALCDKLPTATANAQYGATTSSIAVGSAGELVVCVAGVTTSSGLNSWLASNTPQFVYELATPQTVQLTAQQVKLLVGPNQIWANSGDVTVEYGMSPNALLNPTLFEARPMLEVEGYGTIAFNGYEIELDNAVMGEVELVSAKNWNSATWRPYLMPKEQEALYNSGDTLTLAKTIFEFALDSSNYATSYLIASATASDNNALFSTEFVRVSGSYAYFKTTISPLTFTAGTYSTITDTVTISATMKDASTKTFMVSIYFSYEAVGTEYTDIHFGTDATLPQYYYDHFVGGRGGALTVNSTVSVLGHPTYIDCDLGEAYMIKDNVPISLDAYIDLGSDLPCLAVGANEFTYDNTVTDLKVIPRWWRV